MTWMLTWRLVESQQNVIGAPLGATNNEKLELVPGLFILQFNTYLSGTICRTI